MKETCTDYIDQIADLVESLLVPGKLVFKVLSIVVNLSRSERGSVLVTTGPNKLESKAQVGFSPNSLNAVRDVCSSFAGDLNKFTGLVYVPDTRKDEKFRKISVLKNSDILSFACIPLKVEGELYGILYLDSTTHAKLFSSLDLERINRYAKMITQAMVREQKLGEADVNIARVSVSDYLAERSIGELEQQQLQSLLEKNNWNVTRTAQAMDMPRRTLYNKMTKYGIQRPHRVKPRTSADT